MSIHEQRDTLFRFLAVAGNGGCAEDAPVVSLPAGRENECLSGRSLAMVYAPCQEFEGLYEPMEGLHAGTIFQALEKPFFGARRVK